MNIWIGVYRAALWTLPRALRRKHGAAMTALFAAEVARADGAYATMRVVVRAVADVLWRGTYEWVRLRDVAVNASPDGEPLTVSTHELFRRVWMPFVGVLIATTSLLVTQFVVRQLPVDSALALAMLSVPFTAAMTIPIAMFIAFFWVSRQLRASAASPVLTLSVVRSAALLAGGVSLLALALATQLLPRANARLQSVMAGRTVAAGARSMSLSALQSAAHAARAAQANATGVEAREFAERAASLDVEFHKKFAISAAVLVLGLVGLVLGWHFPRAGLLATGLSTVAVIGAYYVLITAGESLADHQIVAPSLAMWAANMVGMLVIGTTMLARRRATLDARRT
jgi:lipopolysaccharide export LptBFGC system permease protein LptF